MKTNFKLLAALFLLTTINDPLSTALAQNTVFTYQGQVLANGSAFTDAGQFQFALVTSTNNNHAAMGTANAPSGGYITGYNVLSGGSGYVSAPAVTVSGGGGAGAAATANLTGGVVTSISVANPGNGGYTSAPTVTLAPPPPAIAYTTYWSNDGTSVNGSEPAASVSVAVTNGMFTVVLGDPTQPNMAAISAALFKQPDLQLRIWFNDGTHGFAALNPAQNLTPAPYALYAANAGNAGSVAASNIVGTVPATQLPANVLTNGASGVNITGTFSGNGGGLSNVPGTLAQMVAASTNFTAQANTAYDLTNSTEVSVTMPTNANVGDVIQVTGTGAGGWQVTEDTIVSWPERNSAPTSANWYGVASSSDGTYLVAVAYAGGIYTSANSGTNWTEQTSAQTSVGWTAVASSSDGTHLVAVAFGSGIYTSVNSGVTWTEQTSAQTSAYWNGVASSSDGTHLVAVVAGGGIYTSANSGVTWTEQTSAPTSAYWNGVASSSDGTHLVAVVGGGGIYTSANSGVTWTEQTSAPASAYWQAVASSSDGTHLVAVVGDGGGIYNSANSGVTWTEQTSAPTSAYWQAVASSSDGTHLVAVVGGGVGAGIYTSANSGVTWTEQTSAPTSAYSAHWYGVASSSDGTHLVAVLYGGGIYTSLDGVTGAAGTSEQFQYLGNGLWQPLPATAGYLSNNGSTVLSPGNSSGLTGTIADGRLSANVALRAGGNAFTGNQSITIGYLGIGLANPTVPLEVATNGVAIMTMDNNGNLECSGTVYSHGLALTSDRSLKENFTTLDGQAVLTKVATLPVTAWNYKTDSQAVQHIGPMAQDFHAAFGLDGTDDKHISVVDEGGVALAAIQGLNQKLEETRAESKAKDAEIQTLQEKAAKVESLEQRLSALEQKLQRLALQK